MVVDIIYLDEVWGAKKLVFRTCSWTFFEMEKCQTHVHRKSGCSQAVRWCSREDVADLVDPDEVGANGFLPTRLGFTRI